MEAVLDAVRPINDMVVNDRMTIDGVNVLIGYTNESDRHVSEQEIRAYIDRGNEKHGVYRGNR